MQRHFVGLLLWILLLAACTPPVGSSPTTVAETATAAIMMTVVSSTPVDPTSTPTPAATPEPGDVHLEELRRGILYSVADDIQRLEDVHSVTDTRFEDGSLKIELRTKWTDLKHQPDVAWMVVNLFANPLAEIGEETLESVAGGAFRIDLSVYSLDSAYRYQSETDWETLIRIAKKTISYYEWQDAASAGFR